MRLSWPDRKRGLPERVAARHRATTAQPVSPRGPDSPQPVLGMGLVRGDVAGTDELQATPRLPHGNQPRDLQEIPPWDAQSLACADLDVRVGSVPGLPYVRWRGREFDGHRTHHQLYAGGACLRRA